MWVRACLIASGSSVVCGAGGDLRACQPPPLREALTFVGGGCSAAASSRLGCAYRHRSPNIQSPAMKYRHTCRQTRHCLA